MDLVIAPGTSGAHSKFRSDSASALPADEHTTLALSRWPFVSDTNSSELLGSGILGNFVALVVRLAGNLSCFVRADFVRVKQTLSARRRTVLGTTRLTVEIHSTLSEKVPKEINVEY